MGKKITNRLLYQSTQPDLIPQFGSESAVSMFMTGNRNLTLQQIARLSARFKLPADVFIPQVGLA